MWPLVSTRDPENQLAVDIERYLDVIKKKQIKLWRQET